MIYVELLMLAVVVIFVVDISGVMDHIKSRLREWLKKDTITLKPLDCSLCMVWWVGLVYALIRKEIGLPVITYICGLAAMSYPISLIITLVQSLVIAFCNWISDRLGV